MEICYSASFSELYHSSDKQIAILLQYYETRSDKFQRIYIDWCWSELQKPAEHFGGWNPKSKPA